MIIQNVSEDVLESLQQLSRLTRLSIPSETKKESEIALMQHRPLRKINIGQNGFACLGKYSHYFKNLTRLTLSSICFSSPK